MSADPYDYANRRGIVPVSWTDFHGLCKGLAQAVAPWRPELVLAVGRGGYYPGTLLAHMLRVEVWPLRLSRREQDVVTRRQPRWSIRPPRAVSGRRVLVVDEISSTGATLAMAKSAARLRGAGEVRTAVLYAHARGAEVPDYVGLVSDGLVLNPWDREILVDGRFETHPEYAAAFRAQGLAPAETPLIAAAIRPPAKSR